MILSLFYFLRVCVRAEMESLFIKQQQPWSFDSQKKPESYCYPQKPILSIMFEE